MRLEELHWMDVESYLKQDDRLMIVCGSTEQHGYLSLTTDVRIPLALADAAGTREGVLVAPALPYGASPYFLDFPGTVSLRASTLMDVVEDLVRSFHRQGFRRFLVLNGHGGNMPVQARLWELANQLDGAHFAWYSWWVSHSVEEICLKYELKPYHASWLEAFPFCRVGDLPQGNKPPIRVTGLQNAAEAKEAYGDGVFGGAYQVSDSIMEEIFQACLLDVLHLLSFDGSDSKTA